MADRNDGPIAKRYEKLVDTRDHYLRRARQAARYTIPSLMPEESHSKSQSLYTPYQGLGQRGLNNLSSKLMLILMPPDQPMFKFDIDDFQLNQILAAAGNQAAEARGELEMAFSRVERAVATDLATTPLRKEMTMMVKQLLVAGNAALFQMEDGNARQWRLDQFVVWRSPAGRLMEFLAKEQISLAELKPEVAEACDCVAKGDNDAERLRDLYTKFWLVGDRLFMVQELNGKIVPGSENDWPAERSPLLVATTNRMPGEHYGRGYVETVCLGDLISYEGLSKSLLEASAMAARVLWMRNPNSVTRAKDLEKANGSVINGNPNDVAALRLDKNADLNYTLNYAQNIEARLEQVFLLNQSVQRQGERVTATEIQFVAQDIEDALGGLYTELASDLQVPFVNYQLARLIRQKRIPDISKLAGVSKEAIKPRITTGLSALGRGQDLRKIQGFVGDLVTFGGEEAAGLVQKSEMVKRMAAGHGIDTTGLIKTDEQLAAEAQAAQQQQMQAQVAPAIAGEAAKVAAPLVAQGIAGAVGAESD